MTGIPAWASGTVLSALPAERVRSLDELEPQAIGRVIASTTPEEFIAMYEASRRR